MTNAEVSRVVSATIGCLIDYHDIDISPEESDAVERAVCQELLGDGK